ncbi:MAG: cobalt ECF transporter T component CbiQ [Methanomassiliicoccales archaeon]
MRHWPPLGKLLLVLSLLVVSLLSQTIFVPILILTIGAALLMASTELRFPKVIALALLEGIGIFLLGAMVIAFLTINGKILLEIQVLSLTLRLTEGGLQYGLLIFFRALAGVSVMLFYATSTPIPHFATALKQLRVPSYITELIVLVYRYSFLLFEQLEILYTAAQCRLGFRGTRNKFRTTGMLAVGLFIRSMEVAERSQIALFCRNFQGSFPSFKPPPRMTFTWYLAPLIAFLLFYAADLIVIKALQIGW